MVAPDHRNGRERERGCESSTQNDERLDPPHTLLFAGPVCRAMHNGDGKVMWAG